MTRRTKRDASWRTANAGWVVGLGAGVMLCAGCAFKLSGDESHVECKRDDDCGEFRLCSSISNRCELQAPAPVAFRFAGPFDCVEDDPQFSGVSVSAAWPPFESTDIETGETFSVAGDSTRISHRCYASVYPGTDCPNCLILIFEGGRHQNVNFSQVGFYVSLLVFALDDLKLGARKVQTRNSSVYFCPTYPQNPDGTHPSYDPYWNPDIIVDVCTQFFELPSVSVTVTTRDSDRLSGYVVGELVPQVIPPESSSGSD